VTGDEILRRAAELGAEQGAAFLSIHFADHPEDVGPVIKAGQAYYDHITRTYTQDAPHNVRALLEHLREALL